MPRIRDEGDIESKEKTEKKERKKKTKKLLSAPPAQLCQGEE